MFNINNKPQNTQLYSYLEQGFGMTNTQKIQRVSALMHALCVLILIFFPLFLLWFFMDLERFNGTLEYLGNTLRPETIALPYRILSFIISMVPVALLMWGLFHLMALFELFRKAVFFSEANARLLHKFAMMLFFSTLASPIARALVSVAVTINNPPGQRAVVVNIESGDLNSLFVATVFLAVAWVMREAHALAQENAEFV